MYEVERIGELDCTIIDDLQGAERPRLAVVICHGFGAPGTDLVSIGSTMLKKYPDIAASTRFYFPAAPIDLTRNGIPGGRAWWMIDFEALQRATQTRNFDLLREEEPQGLKEARDSFEGIINYIEGHDGIPISRIVVGGFSQGAMLTTDFALRSPQAPGGLVVFSGMLTNAKQWRELAAKRGALRVLQTHGYADPILPFVAASWLKELFEEAKLDLEFVPFQGPHTIPLVGVDRLAELLKVILELDAEQKV